MSLDSLALAHKARYLMARQEQTGIKFDIEGAKKLVSRIETEMKEIEGQVLPQLPRRKLKQSEMANYKFPKKCYNMDGSPSALMQRFAEKHNGVVEGTELVVAGERIPIVGDTYLPADMPMDLSNQEDIKEWLLDSGWRPSLWNFKRDPNTGRPMRDENRQIIKTSPKLQDKGKLCENLEELAGPLVKLVVRWLTLRHRLSFVTGLLSQPRLMVDGRLPSGSSGVTNTFRQKHKVVANLPKAEEGVAYGKEIRGLFIADDGMVLVGFDASALEARVKGSYTFKYDGGDYARELLEGDVHSKNAWVFFRAALEERGIMEGVSKDDARFKPFRSRAKNGDYCLSYGGTAGKLAETLGVARTEGTYLYERYWGVNWALAKFKEAVEKYWETQGNKEFVKATDGRMLRSRSRHSLVNLLFQSCGAIAMDIAGCYLDSWLGGLSLDEKGLPSYNYKGYKVRRVAYVHDEYVFECSPEIAKEVGELGVKAIVKAGELLKLKVPLAAEYKIGSSWRDTH